MLIENDGPDIVASDYWDSQTAKNKFFFLSFNAGAARLLAPDSMIRAVDEMKTAKLVIISFAHGKNRDVIEILFDDDTASPLAMHIGSELTDQLLPPCDHGRDLTFSVWARNAVKLFEKPAKFRMVKMVPCLKPWKDKKPEWTRLY